MSGESRSWTGLFSSALEEFIIYSSEDFSGNLKNKNSQDYKLASRLTTEEIEAYVMYINRQSGIFPNQYHHFYEQGDTIIYQEHIADLYTIDRMFENRRKYREGKQKQEQEAKELQQKMRQGQKTTMVNKGGASKFYGKKFTYAK